MRHKIAAAFSSCSQSEHRIRSAAILLTGLVTALFAAATNAAAQASPATIRVATYNQYLGADLAHLVTASPADFNAAFLEVLEQIAENRFHARARRQAALIIRADPDLIGLQEVWAYACQELPPTAGACSEPSIRGAFVDQLSLTLRALKARGAHYSVAATVKNFDTAEIAVTLPGLGTIHGLPFTINGKNAILFAKDRDVILRRSGLPTQPVAFAGCKVSDDGCNYETNLTVPLPIGGSVDFKRGFVAVDAVVRGHKRRFVNTHLEVQEPQPGNPASRSFQAAQAAELIERLAATPQPAGSKLLLVGDLNSAPTDVSSGFIPPYQQLLAANYIDTWVVRHGAAPGPTCCQDTDLRNPASKLLERIDHVFVASALKNVLASERIGESVGDKTEALPGRPALWPSDHAGVAASLRY